MLSTNNKTNCFISKANKIHGNRYVYSNVNYITPTKKKNVFSLIRLLQYNVVKDNFD